MILQLQYHHVNLLKKEIEKVHPVEACAMLFGKFSQNNAILYEVKVAPNRLQSTVKFEIDPTRVVDALTKAENLIDNLGTTDFESYLTAEDVELAGTTLGGASQEVNRALAEMQAGITQVADYLRMGASAQQEYQSMEAIWDKNLKDWIAVNLI